MEEGKGGVRGAQAGGRSDVGEWSSGSGGGVRGERGMGREKDKRGRRGKVRVMDGGREKSGGQGKRGKDEGRGRGGRGRGGGA